MYALAARLFWLNNDSKYALWCYSKVLAFQIEDVSDFGGGFGDQDSGMVYAFDQLEALLMLRMVQELVNKEFRPDVIWFNSFIITVLCVFAVILVRFEALNIFLLLDFLVFFFWWQCFHI